MKRVLIVRMGSMGDIVHTLPAVATLRRRYPEAEIDWVVEKHWAPLLARNPHVAQLHLVETKAWRRNLGESGTWKSLIHALSGLRRRKFDCALDFQGLIKSAVLARLCGAEQVIGFERRELREAVAGVLYTGCAPTPAVAVHVVERNLALAAAAGAVEPVIEFPLCAAPEEIARMRDAVREAPGFVLISPSAGWPAKRWPEERYAELASRIIQELRRPVAINCGPGEEETASRIVGLAAGAKPLVMKPGIGELIALAGMAALTVGGDTGPLHVAAARGTPVVAIFGPTDPARNGPYGPATRIVRSENAETTYARDAGRHAISSVPVSRVFDAVRELLPG